MTVLSPEAGQLHEERLLAPGMLAPVLVPWALIPVGERQRLLTKLQQAPPHLLLDSLLAAEEHAKAWRLIDGLRGGLRRFPKVQQIAELWSAKQLAEARLPAPSGGLCIVGPTSGDGLSGRGSEAIRAYRTLRELTRSLPWPFWAGPVLIAPSSRGELLGSDAPLLARPALPVLRYGADTAALNGVTTGRLLSRLLSQRLQAGHQPLPLWFSLGLEGVVAAKVEGRGPSPRGMLLRRQEAGSDALSAALAGGPVDAGLATAILTPLIHTSRRHHFASLVDLLRNGTGSEQALRLAYDLGVEELLQQR